MTDQSKSSRSGLKRAEAPVDIFTLQPEPELIPESQVTEDEKTKGKPPKKVRAKRSASRQISSPKLEPKEKEASPEEKNEHVSVYLPSNLVTRLDVLKRREKKRLKDEKKIVARSTLIREAVEQYLEAMES